MRIQNFKLKIQLQESWLDDVDGPKFLRGAEEEIQEDSEELDAINVSLLLLEGRTGTRVNPPYRPDSQSSLPQVIFEHGTQFSCG